MSKYKQIAIGDIRGKHGRDFSSEVKNKLVESERFKVIDRSRMDAILKELNLSQSDLTESKNRAKLGKLLSASALITGYLDGKYKEDRSSKKGTCYEYLGNGEKREYSCTTYYREGTYSTTYSTNGSIDVVDVETGEILRSKALSAAYVSKTSATDATPASIDKDSLYTSCLQDNVGTFIKSIAPWEETVQVPFKKDGDIPALERGINQAKMGEMEEAIKIFASAAKAAEGNAEIDSESIATAYWDLGLAYEYTWKLDKAIEAFKKAYSFDADDDYITEKKHAEKLKAEKRKLEEQNVH
jgi:tetratricopeptide (TPR) repeat protein